MGFSLTRLFRRGGPVVPVVRMSGAIGVGMTFRQGLSLSGIEGARERAHVRLAPGEPRDDGAAGGVRERGESC